MKQVFVSYRYEEEHHVRQLERWAQDGRLGVVQVSKELEDVRQHGEAAIKRHLEPRIRGCAAVLLLVGDSSHDRRWQQYEVSVAQSLGKPVIAVRLPNTAGLAPPTARHLELVPFNPDQVRAALERA